MFKRGYGLWSRDEMEMYLECVQLEDSPHSSVIFYLGGLTVCLPNKLHVCLHSSF